MGVGRFRGSFVHREESSIEGLVIHLLISRKIDFFLRGKFVIIEARADIKAGPARDDDRDIARRKLGDDRAEVALVFESAIRGIEGHEIEKEMGDR